MTGSSELSSASIDVTEYLREIKKLSKKQFLCKLQLKKILSTVMKKT